MGAGDPPIHRSAAQGFAREAPAYTRGRPDYPAAIEGWLRARLHLSESSVAVDLGAGTGKFTQRLLATGCRVIAIEPVDAMRAQLAQCLHLHDGRRDDDRVQAFAGSAESLPLADESVDAVVCAQAFHWFASRAALGEIRRVLRRGGVLGLVWNVRDENAPWSRELTRIMEPYEGDAPRYRSGLWRRLFPAPGFGALHEERFSNIHAGPAERVIVDRVMSVSFIAALERTEQQHIVQRLRELIARTPALRAAADIEVPYETCAFSAVKA